MVSRAFFLFEYLCNNYIKIPYTKCKSNFSEDVSNNYIRLYISFKSSELGKFNVHVH